MADNKKVLIIEDDKILHKAIKDALLGANFEIAEAFDGEEGLKKAESENPDLILLDLILPKQDGYHTLVDLHEKYPNTPVFVLTVINSKTSVAECMANGAKGYLVKSDYSLEDIVEKVKEFI